MVAAFNLEKVVFEVLAKVGMFRAEQLAGLMPSTSLSPTVFGCLEKSEFSGLYRNALVPSSRTNFMRASPNARFHGGNEIIDKIGKNHAIRHSNLLRKKNFMLSLRPWQPRLDSGSLSAGWFPLPDAVGGLLGCHPSVPPLSVFVDLRAALGHVDCCARKMRAVVGD